MKTFLLTTLHGATTELSEEEVNQFSSSLRGELLTPDSSDYDQVRAIWNSMIDRSPGLIVRCLGVADVIQAINFARTHELLVAVRGGGHNIAGNAVCDGGILIDLSLMRSVYIDPNARTARVEPGCRLGDIDHETQAFKLALPLGINSTTGISGLTLGGGFGWLSRKFGMTVDSLLSADIVTADGKLLHTTKEMHPDLFWAIRGGGGNFGVVTSFEFQLYTVGPEVLSGLIIHPFEDAKKVLQFYREFTATLPDETVVWTVLRKAPPLPFLPEEWHGKEVVVFPAFHAGNIAEGERILEPLRRFGNPIADVIGPKPYVQWQQAFDPLLAPGARNYWKSHNFTNLSDELLDTIISYASQLPSPQSEIFLGQVGGKMERLGKMETAYPHRDSKYILNVHARWEDLSGDKPCTSWARTLFSDTAAYATGGVYINFLSQDETERTQAAYGPNYERLVEVKNKYDSKNFFRLNQNIRPSILA